MALRSTSCYKIVLLRRKGSTAPRFPQSAQKRLSPDLTRASRRFFKTWSVITMPLYQRSAALLLARASLCDKTQRRNAMRTRGGALVKGVPKFWGPASVGRQTGGTDAGTTFFLRKRKHCCTTSTVVVVVYSSSIIVVLCVSNRAIETHDALEETTQQRQERNTHQQAGPTQNEPRKHTHQKPHVSCLKTATPQ